MSDQSSKSSPATTAVAVAAPVPVANKPSRRDLMATLFGVAAGGAALHALTACGGEGSESQDGEDVGEATQAFSGDAIKVEYADSIAELRAISGGAVSWVAILGGAVTCGDGGGGVFYWDSTAAVDNGVNVLNVGGLGSNSAGWRRVLPLVAPSVAILRTLVGSTNEATLLGYWGPNDGGGGVFVWSTTPAIDDGGTILNAGGLGSNSVGWRRKYSGALNVRWFGAKGDGSTDDQPALQKAIDSSPTNAGAVYLPRGRYRINAPLVIEDDGSLNPGKRGIRITGAHAGASGFSDCIIDCGFNDASKPLLSLKSRDCIVEHVQFRVPGGTSALAAIDVDRSATPNCPASNHVFRYLSTLTASGGTYTYAVRLGNGNSASQNIENMRFEKCYFTDYIEDGIFLGNTMGQAKHNVVANCHFSGGKTGIRQRTGSFYSYDCGFNAHSIAAICLHTPTDTISIINSMSEKCARFLMCPDENGGTAGWPVQILGGRHATDQMHADGRFLLLSLAGPFTISGVFFGRESPNFANFKIAIGNWLTTTASIIGCHFPNDGTTLIAPHVTPKSRIVFLGNSGQDNTTAATLKLPDRIFSVAAGGVQTGIALAPEPRPTVTGSRATNALAASIVDALAALGLVTDGTTP